MQYVIGVDVGTGSARAGVFDEAGLLIGSSNKDITLYQEPGGIAEQSSTEIWDAVCFATRSALVKSGVDPHAVVGIGFDATCSMVVVGENGAPLSVGPSGSPSRNIIVWMDHRALDQTERINATGHNVLEYVGGTISPEMQTPKLLWLKENKPAVFNEAWQFFDLVDFLTWKATGSLQRSMCTVTCKWTYLGHELRWDESFFKQIGLGELAEEDFARIGTEVVEPSSVHGAGLLDSSAEELGLRAGTTVAAGLIDGHAGGLGTVGSIENDEGPTKALAYVFGTSACTMTSTNEPVFVPGVWGPYFSAMVPGLWLNEGGQTAGGAAIAHLVNCHPAVIEAREKAKQADTPLLEWLADSALAQSTDISKVVLLAKGLHIVPEFLGNRSPNANPYARAVIAGLGMDVDISSLISLYVAGICSLGYGLRQIIDSQAARGASIDSIVVSGGAATHPLIRQLLADTTNKPVMGTDSSEPVLLGASMLGAVASRLYPTIEIAMSNMSHSSETYLPTTKIGRSIHDDRYRAFISLQTTMADILSV